MKRRNAMTSGSQFSELDLFSYDLIMADPAWLFKNWSEKGEHKNASAKYDCMTLEEIMALPVGHLANKDCVLFLWTTWPMLLASRDFESLPPEKQYPSFSPPGAVIQAWGFRYVSGGAWHKKTVHGKTAFGNGYRVRSSCEPFLLAVMGKPDTSRAERNLIEGLRREHSRKPESAYAWCERYLPGARRIELFSRQNRPGWDSWGDEVGKFDGVDA